MKEIDRGSPFSDDFFDISIDHVGIWDESSKRQLKRLHDETDAIERLIDFVFLVISLHNYELSFRRHRDELWQAVGRGPGSVHRRRAAQWADKALRIFDEDLPHMRDLRNIFSHLEEYAYGVGQLQRSGEPLSVKSGGTNVYVVKDADNRFELNLDDLNAALDKIRQHVIEIMVYFDP
jgi:hypothetical protein